MNYMTKIADYEAAVERRLEKSCERSGWIASAHFSFDADYFDVRKVAEEQEVILWQCRNRMTTSCRFIVWRD